MIYHKLGGGRRGSLKSYNQEFEYMFIFSKGVPKTIHLIEDKKNKYSYSKNKKVKNRQKDGSLKIYEIKTKSREYSVRNNIWDVSVGKNKTTLDNIAYQHPAMFPEKLVRDHIYSWSNEGDIVLDPFSGSGTTSKMAYLMYRKYIGVDISTEYCDIARQRIEMHKDECKHQDHWDALFNPEKNQKSKSPSSKSLDGFFKSTN